MSAERLAPLAAAALTEDQRQAAAEFREGRGYAVHGPFAVMLRSPEVMLRAKAMGDYLRFRSVLPKRVSEMAILITAREWTQQFEWTYHYRYAMEAGLAREVADAIGEGRRPPGMAEDEAAAYAFTIELHRHKGVSDATYAHARALFGERGSGRCRRRQAAGEVSKLRWRPAVAPRHAGSRDSKVRGYPGPCEASRMASS
jgi:4-carboxymuconolactone decarboxylase